MSRVDSACEDIIRNFTNNSDYQFEKQAEAAPQQQVDNPEVSVKLPESVNLRKIASAIREAAAPVVVSYEDVNEFINKELSHV